jgi:two-component system cell cycle response regulator
VTTEAAERVLTVPGDLAELEATLIALESQATYKFRTLRGPADECRDVAAALGAAEAEQRAILLQAGIMLRDGRIAEGGQTAHRVLAWAQLNDSPYVLARAHRELSIFYRLVGDLADSLKHGVECLHHLPGDVPPVIRARHLVSLAVALDETGSVEEGDRRSREALAIASALGDADLALLILNNMAYSAYENGDQAAADARIADMRVVQAGDARPLGANELDTIARIDLMAGRYDSVEVTLAPVLAERVLANEGDAVAECLLTLAESRRLGGRYEAAQEALDRGVRECEGRGLARIRARVHEEQAALYAAVGRFAEAYEEHRIFHAQATALLSTQRDARARALQAVFEATEARRTSEHFREMALRDVLTGLYNRRYVNERLPELLIEAAGRHAPLSVALVDLDHFKRVNDELSHATGDTVLQEIAALLQEAAAGSAIAARLGGEEFVLIMPGLGAAEAARRCERLRLRVRGHDWAPITGSVPVTASIGVTTAFDGRSTVSALLSNADRNLYTAKREGRDQVVVDPAPQ